MTIYAKKDNLIDSLKAANREKEERISSLMGDIILLKEKVRKREKALEIMGKWYREEKRNNYPKSKGDEYRK